WRTAGTISRDVLDGVARLAQADGRRDIVVIDAPDRMAGWGPISKAWVWRNGLPEALGMRGLRLVAQAHTAPGDPEVMGLRPSTLAWTQTIAHSGRQGTCSFWSAVRTAAAATTWFRSSSSARTSLRYPEAMSSRRRALVVVPTYNERENIGPITGGILAATAEVDVLVV